jgi:predicted dithiol-disulfide oxidoreductase (DUF899 family)
MANLNSKLTGHPVVSRQQWFAERVALLAKEKEFTRLRDELSRQRRDLPWVKVDKTYTFDTPTGRQTLAELFESKNQLIVYHFMFAPEWDEGCPHCSFWADHYDGMVAHLKQRDVTFVVISRAPLAKIQAFKKRMGWNFKWVSSGQTDFNYDFNASFAPEDVQAGTAFYNYEKTDPGDSDREGISVFYKDESGAVLHTYSCYARGIDMVNTTYQFLDLAPKGRDEEPGNAQDWVLHHDKYTD